MHLKSKFPFGQKVLVIVAHPDDETLAVGGFLANHAQKGGKANVVVCSDGKHSHKVVLGITQNPSAKEVKHARKKELLHAIAVLGVGSKNLDCLNLCDGEGRVWQNQRTVKSQVGKIIRECQPNTIIFHATDAHPDHKAVNMVVHGILRDLKTRPRAYEFFVWTKELAAGRPEVDLREIPEIPSHAIKVGVGRSALRLKWEAMFSMSSQVQIWPYPDWQIQTKPILDKNFLEHFLKKEEIFVEV